MKRIIICLLCLIFSLIILLCACSHESIFTKNENNNIVSNSGVEYTHLANEVDLYYFGNLEFVGSIHGEKKTSQHLGDSYKTGMFSIKEAENDNILIRHLPDNEWFAIYRKASLPDFDFSVENISRLEFVSGTGITEEDLIHTTCGDGITDRSVINAFLSEIRMQKGPREAGLYELIEEPDGTLRNCYFYGVIYGFFDEEPNLAVRMDITSYNDLAYSIFIEGKEYVLPTEWLEKFEN